MKKIIDKYSSWITIVGAALLLGLAVLVGKAEANESESLELLARDLAQLHVELYGDCSRFVEDRAREVARHSYTGSDQEEEVLGTISRENIISTLKDVRSWTYKGYNKEAYGAVVGLINILESK